MIKSRNYKIWLTLAEKNKKVWEIRFNQSKFQLIAWQKEFAFTVEKIHYKTWWMHKNNKLHITLTEQIKNALQYWLRFDNVKYYDDFSKNTINAVLIFLRGIFS